MKNISLLFVIAFTFLAAQPAVAQNANDSLKLITGHTYLITKTDNAQLKGKIMNQSDGDVMVNESRMGIVLIHKADIKSTVDETPVEAARIKENHERLTYFEIGAGGGTSFYFGTDLTFVFKNDHLLSAGFHFSTKGDPHMPSGYPKDWFGLYPQVTYKALSINYGRVFIASGSHVRRVLKGGITVGSCSVPTNYEYKAFTEMNWSTSSVVYRYVHDMRSVLTGGLLFQPEIQFPLTPRFGINIGGYIDVNTATTPSIGVDAKLMFGKVMMKTHKG
jgi:hypothetical protein